ncbi:MAG: S8 family serine peptidase [Candidatus Tenebribacter burtonii]|nr:S8 family serine peptidase [Candidatus Tenebribacter burtonii]
MKKCFIFTILLFLFISILFSFEDLLLNEEEIIQIPDEFQSKIDSGFLIRNISNKIQQLNNGVRNDETEYAKVILYFAEYPSNEIINTLENQGVECYLDSWVPPLENHPNGFIIASIPTECFLDVLSEREIVRIASGEKKSYPQNNRGYAAINADDVWTAGWDGTGVKVAVLDSGLDSYYDGTDMPSSYDKKDYSEYDGTPGSLDDDVENTHLRTGHGTHVAGTVLGRGSLSASNIGNGGGSYKGMAPDADLCFLKIEHDTNGGATGAAISGALTAAVSTYNADVITMSYGGWSTYHDGSDSNCQIADWCYAQGVPVFMSSGNDANDDRHYSGTVAAGAGSTTEYIQVNHAATSDYVGFNMVWDDGSGRNVDLDISYYDSGYSFLSKSQYSYTESPRGTESRQTRTINLEPAGTYYVKITNNSGTSQFFHLYELFGASTFQSPDPFYTCGSPAEADNVFAVGAWTTDRGWTAYDGGGYYYSSETNNDIFTFSNRGPRIDGVQKPQIAAPGASVISIRDTDVYTSANPSWVDNNGDTTAPHNYYVMLGTSMSCPMAAGAAALILDRWPGVTPQQVYDAIQNNANTDGYTGAVPNDTWGYGKLDVFAAINDDTILPVTLSSFTTAYSNNQPTINWVTQSESNNAGWNIYRANFSNLGQASILNLNTMPGNGTTSGPSYYSFIDEYDVYENFTYWYWLESICGSGETEMFGPVSLTIPAGGNEIPEIPMETELNQNFPNPFNPSTSISFDIKENETGVLSIYNVKGQLIVKEEFAAGKHYYVWDARDYSSGIYFYKLQAKRYSMIMKMLLVK